MTGRLAIVGLGPGAPGQLTLAALGELKAADVIVGYSAYLDRLSSLQLGARMEGYPLGEEVDRAQRAVELAAGGASVVLVSSGDAGVYGMAPLALQAAHRLTDGEAFGFQVEVIAGVSAAQAAAAVLGSPLALDYAALSLSDRLIPWRELSAKLAALARCDIALALYNPASRTRLRPWKRAVQLIQRHRDPLTPAAVVHQASHPEQTVRLATVAELHEFVVDMNSIVIVGSRRTRQLGQWLVTLRDWPQAPEPNG